jgi:hypothetical protein
MPDVRRDGVLVMSLYLSLSKRQQKRVHSAILASKQRVLARAVLSAVIAGELSGIEIAARYGVGASSVSDIKSGRLYAKWTTDLRKQLREIESERRR